MTAEPCEAESNPTGLLMQQTPIKVEADGSPTADYNPAQPLAAEVPVSKEPQPAQELGSQPG